MLEFEKELEKNVLDKSLMCNEALKKLNSNYKNVINLKNYTSFSSNSVERCKIGFEKCEDDAESFFYRLLSLALLNKNLPYLKEYSSKLEFFSMNEYRLYYTIKSFELAKYEDFISQAFQFYWEYEFERININEPANLRISKLIHRLKSIGSESTPDDLELYIMTLAEKLKFDVFMIKTEEFGIFYKYLNCKNEKEYICNSPKNLFLFFEKNWFVFPNQENIVEKIKFLKETKNVFFIPSYKPLQKEYCVCKNEEICKICETDLISFNEELNNLNSENSNSVESAENSSEENYNSFESAENSDQDDNDLHPPKRFKL